MPAAQPRTTTRARDLDRSAVCAALDSAYADGQLDKAEHGARTRAAMTAKTLGELRSLAGDLQAGEALAPPAERPSRTRLIVIGLVATLLFLGIGFGIGYASGSSVAARAGAGEDVAPVVVRLQGLHTQAGFTEFVEDVRERFGTTEVAGAVLYPEYASVTVPVPGEPARELEFAYRGGFEESSDRGTREPTDPLVDLGAVQIEPVLGLVAGAGDSLNVEDPTPYVVIGLDGVEPRISVYAPNEFGESGYLEADLTGEITAVHPYVPS